MAVSTATATAMLGGLPSTLYVQLHSGDPGVAGTANVVAGASRGTATLLAASGGQRSASGNVDCTNVPQGASVSHVSYWDASSGGSFQFAEPLGVSVSFVYAGTLRFTSEVFTVTSDTTGGSQTSTSVNTDTTSAADSNLTRMLVAVTDTASTSDSNGESVGTLSNVTDTGSTADSNATKLSVVQSDTSSTSDSNATASKAVHTDTASTSDSNGASVGAFSSNSDTASTSDSNSATYVDNTAPTISSFSVPSTASSTSLTGISAGATDDVGVTGYIIKEVANGASAPTAVASDCTQTTGISAGALSSSSLTFTASTTGARDFYLFARDAAGNVTRSTVSTCTIAASGPSLIDDFSTNTIASYTLVGDSNETSGMSVTGGKLRATNVDIYAAARAYAIRTGSSLQDGVVELTVNFDSNNGTPIQYGLSAGVIFRRVDATHYLSARLESDESGTVRRVCLFQANGGAPSQIATSTSFTITSGTDYILRVEFSGSSVTVKVDGTARISNQTVNVTSAGAYGVDTYRQLATDDETYWDTMGGTVYFDDLKAG